MKIYPWEKMEENIKIYIFFVEGKILKQIEV